VYDDGNQDSGTWNHWELVIHGTEVDLDSDNDGITDSNETDVYGTDPNNPDTDYDGLSDFIELFITGTNATDADTDDDLLNDGQEVNVNNTDPFDNDTDGDGLIDGLEVLHYFTNPLVADPDADADTYYWFQDCNDSNDQIYPTARELLNGIDDDCDLLFDEGFNSTDRDGDNLSDYSEYHAHGTNWSNYDTDGDLLSDGDEVLIHLTNPLVKDNDSDSDGWYWFQDCNDTNPAINPDIVESLDGIDNNCRDGIDEDFIGQDSDSDGLLDLFEFNNLTTDPFDEDSDGDGLNDGTEYNNLSTNPLDKDSDGDGLEDGTEVHETMTNPLIPDLDNDSDGFRWFEECDDTNPLINPNADEFWNGIDDDCDTDIDEEVDRLLYISWGPEEADVLLNATFDDLELSIDVDLSPEEIQNLNLTIVWLRNGSEIASGTTFSEPAWNCVDNQTAELGIVLCNNTGFIGPWIVNAVISDGKQDIYVTWYVSYEVWHPPEPVIEVEDEDTENSVGFSIIGTSLLAFLGLGLIIVVLLVALFIGGKRPPKMEQSVFVDPRYQSAGSRYEAVPSAPILPPPPGMF
jgi:hypothetical protein